MVRSSTPPFNILVQASKKSVRAINGTIYTNNYGRTLWVHITVYVVIANNGDQAAITTHVNGQQVAWAGFDTGLAGIIMSFDTTMIVPPGQTYQVATIVNGVGTSVTLWEWTEGY